ncbi:MAG: hypothetical protein ACRER0_02085 [Gammaproteobacteria bacterium]
MILLLPILWLILWAAIGVVICALLSLPVGTRVVKTAIGIFVFGAILLPLVSWMVLNFVRRVNED